MNKKIATVVSILLVSPAIALADFNAGNFPPAANVSIDKLVTIVLNFIWPVFMGFAVIMFIVAGFQFLVARGDPSTVSKARMFVLWGVVGVAVGILAFSLPFIIRKTLNIG